jgi:hypothetical protein
LPTAALAERLKTLDVDGADRQRPFCIDLEGRSGRCEIAALSGHCQRDTLKSSRINENR